MTGDRSSLTEERLAAGLEALGAVDPADVERLRRSIVNLPDRSSQRWPALGRTRVLGAALVAVAGVALVVALLPAVDRSTAPANNSTSSTPGSWSSTAASTRASSVPSASPTVASTPQYVTGDVGFDGTFGWDRSATGLAVSSDAGRTWQAVELPEGLDPAALMDPTVPANVIAGAADRGLWIAVVEGESVRLYRWSAAAQAWSTALLTPRWNTPTEISGPPNILRIVPGPGGLVSVAVTIAIGTAAAENRLFLSTDDGRTFVQRTASGAEEYWHTLAFASPMLGALTQGAGTGEAVSVLHTTDGGATWTASSVPPATAGFVNYGQLAVEGSNLVLPVTTWAETDSGILNATFQLLVSHDGGASFSPSGSPIGVGTDIGPETTVLGSTIWVVPGQPDGPEVIEETGDTGRTWTAITPEGLPAGRSRVTLTGPSSAVAVAADSGCAGFKSQCWTSMWLVHTTDGGRTWTP